MAETWRLIRDSQDGEGGWNMARDEAILTAVGKCESLPTLRLYGWSPACLSLGSSQKAADCDLDRIAAHGWGLVRRRSGGRAILHTDELTYSVALPLDHPLAAGGVLESYRRISVALLDMAGSIGVDAQLARRSTAQNSEGAAGTGHAHGLVPPVCFETPSDYEIVSGGRKLIGSAQVRILNGVLQHGTLPLSGDLARICDALAFPDEAARDESRQAVRDRAITFAEAAGRSLTWDQVAEAMIRAFAATFDLNFVPDSLSGAEIEQAGHLVAERYVTPQWTFSR